MFGIGFGEMLVIAVVVLIAVGPKKMPTFMKAVGKGVREFRHATRELKNAAGLDELLRDEDLRNPLAKKPKKHKPRPNYALTEQDFLAERPPAGADVSHAVAHPKDAQAHREPPAPVDGSVGPVFPHDQDHESPQDDAQDEAQDEPALVAVGADTEGSTP